MFKYTQNTTTNRSTFKTRKKNLQISKIDLSPTEKKMLNMLQEGYGLVYIGKLCGFSKRKTYKYCKNICDKLHIRPTPKSLRDYIEMYIKTPLEVSK